MASVSTRIRLWLASMLVLLPFAAGAANVNPGAGIGGPITGPRPITPISPYDPVLIGVTNLESRLGFIIIHPLLVFNNGGMLSYTPGAAANGGLMQILSDPLSMQLTPSTVPFAILPFAGDDFLSLSLVIDETTGEFVEGVPGDDFQIVGQADINNDGMVDVGGLLLAGEVIEYMGEDSGDTTDFHDFRIRITGGELAYLYPSGQIGVNLTSEQSSFDGSYTQGFSGTSMGTLGRIPCKGVIGNFVWIDTNLNGIQDPGEPGIADVELILTDQFGGVQTTTTNSDGTYKFADLCKGTYTLEVNDATIPPGLDPTLINAPGSTPENDSNDPDGTTVVLPADSGEDLTYDYGYIPVEPAALGDFVWLDGDMDGFQDAGEPGIEGVMVNLYTCGGAFVGTMVTDINGFYFFNDLAPGCYQVEFILPPGLVFSPMDNAADTLDSDPDPTTGFTDQIVLAPGEVNPNVDAGMFPPPSAELGDRFWLDENGNGIQDPGEPGIPGVPVDLIDCTTGDVLDSTTTDGTGMYLFGDLDAGCYQVQFTPPQDCELTLQDEGADDTADSDADPASGITDQVFLADDESNLTVDGGCYFTAGLGDFVWNDLDMDGEQDPGEPGIPGLTVVLLDGDMVPTGMSTITGPAGEYQFLDLAPGSYFVQFTAPPGFVFTVQDAAADDVDSDANGVGKTDKITLSSGEFDPTIDAGVFEPPMPAISIEKSTNGDDADNPTGPFVPNGGDVLWEYVVTNTGTTTLFNIVVTDDQGVAVNCPTDTLLPGDSFTCTGNGTGTVDQYMNIGAVCGTDGNTEVCDDDPSHYFGSDPSIDIEKATNGEDADDPTGPFITPGAAVTWTYVVTNTGNVPLTNVVVNDDQGVTVTCPLDNLQPGQIMTCMGNGTAVAGQYANNSTVTGEPPVGDPVDDEDPSHYFGALPAIDIEKATNGEDADNPTGPFIAVGGDVNWTYVVTNTGNVDLTNVVVTDSEGAVVTCPADTLAVGDMFTCTASGIATVGQYFNLGTVTGDPPVGPPVDDDDPSHYFGALPEIDLEKLTEGDDADNPTGPFITPGDPVTWTYVITNTGNVLLDNIVLNDDQLGPITCDEGPIPALDVGDSFICTVMGIAVAGQYMNIGDVCGTATFADGSSSEVCDDDPSHYFGSEPDIEIEKLTNGINADDPNAGDAPQILPGDPVMWTYIVTNTGNVALTNVSVTDDQGVAVSCPTTTLAPGDSFTCTASGVAEDLLTTGFTTVPGLCGGFPTTPLYENMGVATGESANGDFVEDADASHYCNPPVPDIDIEKLTNGVDADDPNAGDAPQIAAGDPVMWTYIVTNTGNVALTNVSVTDDQGVAVSCPTDTLAPGASFTCTASGVAEDLLTTGFTTVPGQCGGFPNTPLYENFGTATGQASNGDFVDDADASHYCNPPVPEIDIEKLTNGVDADDPNAGDAPQIMPGDPVMWTYIVTNTGNVPLTSITVADDQGVPVSCPGTTLEPGDSFTCTASGFADDLLNTGFMTVPGLCGGFPNTPLYENTGIAVGVTPASMIVRDEDLSHYCNPPRPDIDIEKLTNGVDADDPNAGDAPQILPGDPVMWTYIVTNTGNVPLTNVSVNDDQGVAVTCPADTLAPGESFTCTASGVADNLLSTGFTTVPGLCGGFPNTPLYENFGSATGQASSGDFVEDADASHYCNPQAPDIDIEKLTNGVDADDPNAGDAPQILPGDPVMWTYIVTNTGNVLLTNIAVNDDQGVAVSCPADTLAPGASFTCTASGVADNLLSTGFTTVPGLCGGFPNTPLYENFGSATGSTVNGVFVEDADASHYCNPQAPDIDIEKLTNGVNADDPNAGDAPQVLPGDAVNWTYIVTNTGNVPLAGVTVADDQGVAVSCPADTLAPGASFTCTASGVADDLDTTGFTTVLGLCGIRPNVPLYENTGIATGVSPADTIVRDEDLSHYCNPEPCALEVSKTCFIPMPASSEYVCDKPIDSLTMIWDGASAVRIKAWKGPVGSELLADIDDIQPGEEITVMGYAGSPNDVFWEVFTGGTSSKIGESKFHLSCSDDEMDGPEDCGLNEGNGKDNDSSLINLWLLEGIVDAGGVLDCTTPPTTGDQTECEFQAFPASCETGDADFLTFQYTGGGCGASDNGQDDHICSGNVNGGASATFTDDDGNSVTLEPGETVTIPRNLAKVMTLTNAGGTETNELHTSCSQPIQAGDIYGSLTLVQIDGQGIGTDVNYSYVITNTSNVDIASLTAIDVPLGPIPGTPSSLLAGQSVTLNASAFIIETTTNIAIVDGLTADGQMCNGQASSTVTILPPPPCEVDGEGLFDHFHSDHVHWKLTNNGTFTAIVESIVLSWPAANGDLIEVKLNGTIFNGNLPPTSGTLDSDDFVADVTKRQIAPGDTKTLELKFDNDIVGVPSDYSITINFEEGCSVTFVNTGLPFSCEGKINELRMIWDGTADPVQVKAYKGDVGDQLLLDQSGITIGDEVFVTGLTGAPNNVYWEIFSGSTKLGESVFHLSCSDNDMNGAEDCGKRQGNGKGNDAGLINDWILNGLTDDDGSFTCP